MTGNKEEPNVLNYTTRVVNDVFLLSEDAYCGQPVYGRTHWGLGV